MDDWDLEAPAAKKDRSSGAPAADGGEDRPVGSAEPPAVAPGHTHPAPAPQGAGVTPPAARRRGERKWWVRAVAGLVLLLIGALAGYFVAGSQVNDSTTELAEAKQRLAVMEKAVSQAEERNWNYYRENQALSARIDELEGDSGGGAPATTSTTVPGQHASYTDGIYMVGEQIAPGDYDGVVNGKVGYWARLRSTDGVIGAIIANGLPRGPFVLTISQSDVAVELRGVTLTSR